MGLDPLCLRRVRRVLGTCLGDAVLFEPGIVVHLREVLDADVAEQRHDGRRALDPICELDRGVDVEAGAAADEDALGTREPLAHGEGVRVHSPG